jgi:hypothetical protein
VKVLTDWVSPPTSIGGLDHLGTQAPCVLIYAQLLPGITNVTDRARYYSFYPWLIWSYDHRFDKDDAETFIERFRRADCLFTLISERHARNTDRDNERHGVAMVGRVQLVSALDRLEAGEPLSLSDFTSQESPHRYFKNQMGGLAQYYAGTLSDLGLMDSTAKPWIKYTKEHGAPLAERVDANVEGDRFWQIVESGSVTLNDLDALSAFCACQITSSTGECQILTDIFFDTHGAYGEEGKERKRSLALIQKLVDMLPEGVDLSQEVFRACVYAAALPGDLPWVIPDSLSVTRDYWSIYVRNDLLSVALQAFLAVALRELQPQTADVQRQFETVEIFSTWFSGRFSTNPVLDDQATDSFSGYFSSIERQAPPRTNWEHDRHEIQIGKRLLQGWNRGDATDLILADGLALLATLALRDDMDQSPYGGLAVTPDALSDYPMNLASFRQRVDRWRMMSMPEMIADLISWCLNTHLRVALRKLRQTGRSTFHLRPTERGLEVVGTEIPPPAPTTPRFSPAVQILRDIGALTRDPAVPNRQTRLTAVGRTLMENACG